MIFIAKDILKKLSVMSLLMALNTSVFSMVQENKTIVQEQKISDFDRDLDEEREEEDTPQRTSVCKKVMRCGCLALIAYLALYHSHPTIQATQDRLLLSHGMRWVHYGHGSAASKAFEKLDRTNDVCRPSTAAFPGCCNAVNNNNVVCCRTDEYRYCLCVGVGALHGQNMFEFDRDGDIDNFKNGDYIQRGNVLRREKQEPIYFEACEEEREQEEDDQKELIEIPDDLFAYTLSGKSHEEDEALVVQVCKRKELPDRMKNALLQALHKNFATYTN